MQVKYISYTQEPIHVGEYCRVVGSADQVYTFKKGNFIVYYVRVYS